MSFFGCSSCEEHVLKLYDKTGAFLWILLLLLRGACIETRIISFALYFAGLLLLRGACIETASGSGGGSAPEVAPLARSMY